jgi:hypothetical protein
MYRLVERPLDHRIVKYAPQFANSRKVPRRSRSGRIQSQEKDKTATELHQP